MPAKKKFRPKFYPRPLIISGPSGVGVTSLLYRFLKKYKLYVGFPVSHTTRKPGRYEIDGLHFHFIDRQTMQQAIDNKEFVEYADYNGHLYGTSKMAVYHIMKQGKICIFDIDTRAVSQIRQTDLDPLMIFIKPPSIARLKARLRAYKHENEDIIDRRIIAAKEELDYGLVPLVFDLIMTNDDFYRAYKELETFIVDHYRILQKIELDDYYKNI